MVTCEQCQSDDIDLLENLDDGRRKLLCVACGHTWIRGEGRPAVPRSVDRRTEALRAFGRAEAADPERMVRVETLKRAFLVDQPAEDPEVAPYWRRYQQIFSREGLTQCDPQDLKDFANNSVGARPGNMSVFNQAWNDLGPEIAAQRTRAAIDYLLYGPDERVLEDRLTDLITEEHGLGMTGFKESLLTRVLCIMQPSRFLPILIYSSPTASGKREIAWSVFGVVLPATDRTAMTIGRLIVWSNDLLVRLAGEGFTSMQHTSQFLWYAKDQQDVLQA